MAAVGDYYRFAPRLQPADQRRADEAASAEDEDGHAGLI